MPLVFLGCYAFWCRADLMLLRPPPADPHAEAPAGRRPDAPQRNGRDRGPRAVPRRAPWRRTPAQRAGRCRFEQPLRAPRSAPAAGPAPPRRARRRPPASICARARKRRITFSTAAGSLEDRQRVAAEQRAGLLGQHVPLPVDVHLREGRRQPEGLLEHLPQRLRTEDGVPARPVLALRGEIGDLALEVHRQAHVVVGVAHRGLERARLVGVGDLRREARRRRCRARRRRRTRRHPRAWRTTCRSSGLPAPSDRSCPPRAPCG